MTNEEIIKIVKQTCNIQDLLIGCIGNTLLRCKEEDFKKKIEQTLLYLDCDAYRDDTRTGFRIFARELLNSLDK